MGVFHTAFLAAAHGGTIINTGPFDAVDACFKRSGVAKFRAFVGEQIFEQCKKLIGSQLFSRWLKTRRTAPLVHWFIRKARKSFSLVNKEGKKSFSGFPGRMYGVHFYMMLQSRGLVKIGVHGPYGHARFRMICQDMIRGLSLLDQRGHDLLLFTEFLFGHVDTGTGRAELFAVFAVSKACVVGVFVGDGTVIDLFRTAITYMRNSVKTAAALLLEIRIGLIAGRAEAHLTPHRMILRQALVFLQ